MASKSSLSAIGDALGHPVRSAILLALLSGESQSAGQLRRVVGGSAPALSYHLRILMDASFVSARPAGRRRLFDLANVDLADAIESLLRFASRYDEANRRSSTIAFAGARSCYDHVAGRLGVDVAEAMVQRGILEVHANGFELGSFGTDWFLELGIDIAKARRQHRSFARACLDWTEQRPHLAGSLGAEFLALLLANRWVRRLPGGRVLKVTPSGSDWFFATFGLQGLNRPPMV